MVLLQYLFFLLLSPISNKFCLFLCQDPHGELKNLNVLIARGSMDTTAAIHNLSMADTQRALEKARNILHEVRLERPRPHLDDKMLTGWNGMNPDSIS